jgi:hypothetical protein
LLDKKLTNSKFKLTCAIVILSTILFLFRMITSDQWVDVIKGVLLYYVGANVVQDIGYNISQSYRKNNQDGAEL